SKEATEGPKEATEGSKEATEGSKEATEGSKEATEDPKEATAGTTAPGTEMEIDDPPAATPAQSKKRRRGDGPEEDPSAGAVEKASGESDASMVIEVGGAGAQESERDSRRPGPDTPKPLEDPKVGEVVSQDLATQEIKRVRRTESSPSPPAAAAAAAVAAGVDGVPENGVTPAEQQQQPQQPQPNGGGKAEGEEKSVLGETGKEGAPVGGSEPQIAGSKGDGQGKED
ncbi:unnamed protein product, partial [Ectocarpus sp. 8 AP-2014]